MTDLAKIALISLRCPDISTLKFPRLGFARAINEMLKALGYAFDLAYVQPYLLGRSQSPVVLEGTEKGRDPNW